MQFVDDNSGRNPETVVHLGPQKLHKLNHLGKHLKMSSPLNNVKRIGSRPMAWQVLSFSSLHTAREIRHRGKSTSPAGLG